MTVLGDVVDLVDCEHKTAPVSPRGEYFAVGTPAMRGNVIDYAEARRIDRDTFDLWTRRMEPRAGDVLFAREAPVGPVVRIPDAENIAPGQRTVLIRAIPGLLDARFLYYLLQSPSVQSVVQSLAAGSTVPHLNVADVRTLDVGQLPGMPVQRAIGEMLGALDDKIAANRDVAYSARELSIVLVGSISRWAPLGDISRMVRNSVDPSSLGVDEVAHFSLPAFDTGSAATDTPASIKSVKNLLQEPVVLVSKLNPRIPRIWAVDRLPGKHAVASTEFVALAARDVGIGSLWAALLDPRFTQSLLERTAGTTGSHQRVKPEQMLDVDVPDVRELAPEKKELVESLCRKVNEAADENQRLSATRDELLPLLMSGKITVKDAEKTVEEVV